MACFHPLTAWQLDTGEIRFSERGSIRRELTLPCGRCIGCRLVKARSWAIRCVHEAQMHEHNAFVTLTYNQANARLSLEYKDFQDFIRRIRKDVGKIRYFTVGEYGNTNFRPHWHALMFGLQLDNAGPAAKNVYRSKLLEKHWPHGYSSWGQVNHQTAGYVTRYAVKKITGPMAEAHYTRLDPATGELFTAEPEMARMSLKPGIGYTWFQKYWQEIYKARDGVVMPGGFTVPPPRYYDELLKETDHQLADTKDLERYIRSAAFADDCTPQRLAVREQCAKAKQRFLKRDL